MSISERIRGLFARQGPNERAARAELRNAERDGLGITDADATRYADRIELGRELDQNPQRVEAGREAVRAAAETQFRPALEQIERDDREPGREATTDDRSAGGDPTEETLRAEALQHARTLRDELFDEMTLENTPASFVNDEYDDDGDPISNDAHSVALEQRLDAYVASRPHLFVGTEFDPHHRHQHERDDDPHSL